MQAFKKRDQLSIEDYLKGLTDKKNLTSTELLDTITKLAKFHEKLKIKERKEKERIEQEKQKERNHIDDVTCMDLPLDYENAFFNDKRAENVHAESVADGLVLSLNTLGRVDIEYIAKISDKSLKEVITALKGSIYQNPNTWGECFYKGWETADEYLTGNLCEKWRVAKRANDKYRGYFKENLIALEKILPPTVATEDIFITLGSPWVPSYVIDDFIDHLFGKSYASGVKSYAVKHDEVTGTWDIPDKNRYYNNARVYSTYGTKRMPALYILEKTLNMRNVAVTDEVSSVTTKSGKKRVINHNETVSALEKQKKLIEAFRKWVWTDGKRKQNLLEIYEQKYSCYRVKRYDGRFLQFPEMNKDITLRDYQKDAIARIIFSPCTLLAHDVGSGKTFVMIAAGMELKRMGLSKKNLYVVPNNLVGQWKKMFIELYPSAKVLTVSPKDFTPSKRQDVLEAIKDGDYDGIIMAYSCFDMIPLSYEYYEKKLEERRQLLDTLSQTISKSTSGVRNERKKIEEELLKLTASIINEPYDLVTFDELGVTRLFVDEAHNYKNLAVSTKASNVLGVVSVGSKKCKDMLDKVRNVQGNGGGVIMATGTPITNSITDAFVMQHYLQHGELELLDLQSFDSWIGMFAEKKTEFEIDVDTSKYRLATRFSKFHNLPELTSILSMIADFHSAEDNEKLPKTDGYTDALIGKTNDFEQYLKNISIRADAIRQGLVKPKEDNMLKITTDGRKAALDLRLVDGNAKFEYQSKVVRCAENVADIYYNTMDSKGAQLVFCDSSTPKFEFNMYDELKRLLILSGIPSDEIAFVHDAETDTRRETLFAKVRRGEVRVLLGSTFKLGLGVNVQTRLVALHHLDVPWRPADMVQREGRILREGNLNSKVKIIRYITEGSFDAYSWQLLESKQRFISALLSGSIKERSGTDISDTVLNYAEVKALAIGNPLIKKRVEIANELGRMYSLKRKYVETRAMLTQELNSLPERIIRSKNLLDKCYSDKEFFKNNVFEIDKEQRQELRKFIFEAVCQNALKESESILTEYKGFKVVLPADMPKEKPFIYLQRDGKYYVEIGEVEKGVMIRIDNCLEGLEERFIRLNDSYEQLLRNRKNIEEELSKEENYQEKIEELTKMLERIDEKLGVKKDD